MSFRILSLCVMALALALIAGTPALADDKNDDQKATKGNTHEGTVVSVTDEKLVMKSKGDGDEAKEHTHTLAPNARVMCDGKECKLEDLKPGQKIRVTTKKGDKHVATRIEALNKKKTFERDDNDKNENPKE